MAASSNRNPIDRYKKCGRSTKFKNSKLTVKNGAKSLFTSTYITKLLMQFLRLYETCRMICYSLLSNDVNFVEIGFKWL